MNASLWKIDMKQFINIVWHDLRRSFRCVLCWRITVGVFFAILVVEAGILFFSVRNFERDRLIEEEREAVVVMRAILKSAGAQGTLDSRFPEIARSLRDGSVLVGARVFDKSGVEIAKFGELPGLFKQVLENPSKTIRRRLNDNTKMDILWPPHRARSPYLVSARIDTSEIGAQIVAFVWRITGLVLLISVFVTIVTMLVLDRMVLSPIISLSDQLKVTGTDPNNPEKYIVETRRSDEWGDVIRAFNQLLRWSGANLKMIKMKETELLIAKEEAEKSYHAKSDFLSSMSHELRTPLNAIIGFSSTMKSETFGQLNEKYMEYTNDIHSSGEHLLKLINDVLDSSAIEAGNPELQEENLDVGKVVEASMNMVNNRATEENIHLTVNADDNLSMLRTDRRRLMQILLNLLTNAIKFTPPDGEVSLTASLDSGDAHVFTVRDTGVGMNEEELAKAMSRFGQVDSGLDRKEKGTGLGLPLTKELVELLGGTFEIDSEKGKGTTVTVRFPPERTVAS